jgi:pimeloyl-ACP methyl ester carboxylesterase
LEAVLHHELDRRRRRLHVLEWPADGPTLICLHHNWSTANIWSDLPGALGGRFRVLSLDAPGHGESEPADPEDPVGDLGAVVRELVGAPAILVGASAGSFRAGYFALEHPELVRRLVLIEPPVQTDYIARISARSQSAGRGETAGRGAPPTTLDALFVAYEPVYPGARPDLLRAYLARTHRLVDGVWRLRVTAKASSSLGRGTSFLDANLARLRMPVLVLNAAKSRLCGPEGGRRVHEMIPGSTLVEVPDAGHLVLLNQPEFAYDQIDRFCAPELAPSLRRGTGEWER